MIPARQSEDHLGRNHAKEGGYNKADTVAIITVPGNSAADNAAFLACDDEDEDEEEEEEEAVAQL